MYHVEDLKHTPKQSLTRTKKCRNPVTPKQCGGVVLFYALGRHFIANTGGNSSVTVFGVRARFVDLSKRAHRYSRIFLNIIE